jgi:hypothetical protein
MMSLMMFEDAVILKKACKGTLEIPAGESGAQHLLPNRRLAQCLLITPTMASKLVPCHEECHLLVHARPTHEPSTMPLIMQHTHPLGLLHFLNDTSYFQLCTPYCQQRSLAAFPSLALELGHSAWTLDTWENHFSSSDL